MRYCGTAGKPGGNRENKRHPAATREDMFEGLNGMADK